MSAEAKAKSIREVNKALAAMGVEERLCRGRGYYYFWHGSAPDWRECSVAVYRISAFTVREWIGEYEFLKKRAAQQ